MKIKTYIAGHAGMVGSALVRALSGQDSVELVAIPRDQLDLTSQQAVNEFFAAQEIKQVYLAAARVGGIHANNEYRAEFIYDNIMMQSNIIAAAHKHGVSRLMMLGSSCIYPRLAVQPMNELELLKGELEPTNEPYAIAKIAGIKMCESFNRQYGTDFRSVMPTNLYGENDNFHPDNSHVIPAMLGRFHDAVRTQQDQVVIWGSGKPQREFLHVDDMASACIHLMGLGKAQYEQALNGASHINIGSGADCSIRELAETIAQVVGYNGELVFDQAKPDGTPRKLLDVGRLSQTGWKYQISLKDGLQQTYKWFLENEGQLRGRAA